MYVPVVIAIVSCYIILYLPTLFSRYLLQDKHLEESGARKVVQGALKYMKLQNEWVVDDYRKIHSGRQGNRTNYIIEVFLLKDPKSKDKWNVMDRKFKIKGVLHDNGSVQIISIHTINAKDIHQIRSVDTDHQTLTPQQRAYITKHHYKTPTSVYTDAPKCKYTGSRSIPCKSVDFSGNNNVDKTQFKINLPSRNRNIGNDNLIQDKKYVAGMTCSIMDHGPSENRKDRGSMNMRCHSLYNSQYNRNECKIPCRKNAY